MLARYINIQLQHVKYMHDHIEAKASIQANIMIRNQWMQSKQSKFIKHNITCSKEKKTTFWKS